MEKFFIIQSHLVVIAILVVVFVAPRYEEQGVFDDIAVYGIMLSVLLCAEIACADIWHRIAPLF